MNNYSNQLADLRNVLDVLNASLSTVRNGPPEPARVRPQTNPFFHDSLLPKPTRSSNETFDRVPPASSQAFFQSAANFHHLNQNLQSRLGLNHPTVQPPLSVANPFFTPSNAHRTISDPLGLCSAPISPFGHQASSSAVRSFQQFLGDPKRQQPTLSSSISQPPAQSTAPPAQPPPPAAAAIASMISSTSTSTTAKSPGKRKATQSRFQELPLFFADLEILHAFTVYVTNRSTIFFTLKKTQVDAIRFNQKSIYLRFCKYDPSRAFQKENLPKTVRVSINSCLVPLELKNPSPDLKSPIDVTARCRAVTTRMANTFEFYLDGALDNCKKILRASGYGIEIVLARKVATCDILQLLTDSDAHVRNYDQTLKLIKERCAGFDEIECEALKVPLTCVITKKIIRLPLVGLKCKHVACFDGATFLEMHENKQEYLCVICNNLIRRNELVRDPWIERILQTTNREAEQIEFDSLGKYKLSQPEKCAPARQRAKRVECITLDGEDEERSSSSPSVKPNTGNPHKRPKLEVISALNLTSISGESSAQQTPSSPNLNGSTTDQANRTFSAGASTELVPNDPNASAIDLTDSDSVIVLDSDTDESNHATTDDSNDTPRYSISLNRADRAALSDGELHDSNDDTEISENDNTINNSDDNTDLSSASDDEAVDSDNADTDSEEDDNLYHEFSNSQRRSRFLSSSDERESGELSDEEDESLSDLSSNSNLSSLSSSSDSRDREPASNTTSFTPLLSRGSLDKRRRRSRRFDYD